MNKKPASTDFGHFFASIKNDPTFLILGSQGSGTNLLARILRSSLDFSVTTDRSLIFNAAANIVHEPTIERGVMESNRVVNSLFPGPIAKRLLPKRYYRQNSNYIGIKNHIEHAHTNSPSEFANFFYSYHAFVASGKKKALKSDDIWQNIDLLTEIIPNYKIFLLIRDPRDNAISIMNKNFGPCEIYHASMFVRNRMQIYASVADQAPDRAFIVKYEELLQDPIECVKRMEDFVGARITPDVEERIESLGIKRNNSQKWRNLAPDSLAISETVFAEQLERFGYERQTLENSKLTGMQKAKSTLRDKILRIPQKIRVKTMRYVHG